jgi:ferredoxin
MGIVPGPREKERDREEHFAADHTALEIALESGWILYARCREAVKCISLCINSNLE